MAQISPNKSLADSRPLPCTLWSNERRKINISIECPPIPKKRSVCSPVNESKVCFSHALSSAKMLQNPGTLRSIVLDIWLAGVEWLTQNHGFDSHLWPAPPIRMNADRRGLVKPVRWMSEIEYFRHLVCQICSRNEYSLWPPSILRISKRFANWYEHEAVISCRWELLDRPAIRFDLLLLAAVSFDFWDAHSAMPN